VNGYINKLEIIQVLPCFTTSGYIRFVAKANKNLSDLIPIIYLHFPPGIATYSKGSNVLTLHIWNRLVTFHPDGTIAVTNTRDLQEAKEILERVKSVINEAYKEYMQRGKPSNSEIEKATKISWLDVYKYLPKLNCGGCGYQTCSTFAVDVLRGVAKLSKCTKLMDPKYKSNLSELKKLLGSRLSKILGL